MGFKDADWAYTLGLPFATTAVLAALAHHTDDKTHVTFVGQQTLADELSASVKTVQRSVGVLASMKVISRTPRRNKDGYRTTDLITLNVATYRTESRQTESPETESRQTESSENEDSPSLNEGLRVQAVDHPDITHENPVVPAKPKPKRRTPIPDDWQPNDGHRDIVLGKTGISLSTEAASFRDHAIANGRKLIDWDAGFRNWLRNANPARYASAIDAGRAVHDELLGRRRQTPEDILALSTGANPSAIHRDDPHNHHDDGNGYCPLCQERVGA